MLRSGEKRLAEEPVVEKDQVEPAVASVFVLVVKSPVNCSPSFLCVLQNTKFWPSALFDVIKGTDASL